MTQRYRLNSLQNELRDVLSLNREEYQLAIIGDEIGAEFIGLNLRSVFQPIINVGTQNALGHEAFLRAFDGKGNAVEPESAFHRAEAYQQLVKFDRLCRTLHTLNFLNMGNHNSLLFLNVHPDLFVAVHEHGRVFERVLHQHEVLTSQVVIEFNESAVADQRLLSHAIANYRELGYRIAIDDFGKQHFNLERLWHLAPEYVKLDGSIIRSAEHSPRLQKILPKLVAIIRDLKAEVIIEGVETQAQFDIARHAGVNFLQGYFLGQPVNLSGEIFV